ncbi:hypothetical protein T265_04622 [Opisthorchis viverrini]|uniref:Uncharacterized protein n=1 Tax=Opisthorchis viverrini TaxID=6198 RepID=A0A074ZMG2_OPIVI|nr:hypothetical protein T265_04622 [Opisthorchis viverrini]KER28578.1 hypothetical protein T265_04622 [Opisthorchis viverrini]
MALVHAIIISGDGSWHRGDGLGFCGGFALPVCQQRTKDVDLDKWPKDSGSHGPVQIRGCVDWVCTGRRMIKQKSLLWRFRPFCHERPISGVISLHRTTHPFVMVSTTNGHVLIDLLLEESSDDCSRSCPESIQKLHSEEQGSCTGPGAPADDFSIWVAGAIAAFMRLHRL